MIKPLLFAALALGIGGLLSFVIMAALSRKGSAPGLIDGRLAPPPETPNAYFATLGIPDGSDVAAAVKATLEQLPGTTVTEQSERYLSAEARSGLFGFVDDVEVLIRPEDAEIDLRSASRIGHSDLGANEARIARFRELWTAQR